MHLNFSKGKDVKNVRFIFEVFYDKVQNMS
jgi:hypothetical protein